MIAVGTRELKNHLSRYLRAAANGEDVVVSVHGKVIARIIPEAGKQDALKSRLAALAADGIVSLPKKAPVVRTPRRVKGKPVSGMVIEDRR